MKRRLVSFSLSIVLLILIAIPTYGYEASGLDTNQSKKIEFDLEPSALTDKVLDNVSVIIYADESIDISVKGQMDPDTLISSYEVSVDLDNKTYTATAADEKTLSSIMEEIQQDDRFLNTKANQSLNASGWNTNTIYVKAQTRDPVKVVLTESYNYLNWAYDYSGATYLTRGCSSWAANPSSLGTHWYSTGTTWGALNQGKQNIQSTMYHYYNNWDFGLPILETKIIHIMHLYGYHDGNSSYLVTQNASGEGNALLSLNLIVWRQH